MATNPAVFHPYAIPTLSSNRVLGREIELVRPLVGTLEVGMRLRSARASYDLVHIGNGLFQPRNANGRFCGIAGNYFFWVSAAGQVECGTQFQCQVSRLADRREAAAVKSN